MLGGLLALASAACFAFSDVSVRRGVTTGTVVQGLVISLPIGIAIFFVAALVSGNLGAASLFDLPAFVNLSLAGISHFVWGRYCNYRALNAIGSNLAAPFQQSNLLFTLALAVWLLGEVLTPLKILGIVLLVLGPLVMLRAQKAGRLSVPSARGGGTNETTTARPAFEPRYAEGYLFAFLSATGYGLSPIFVRAALDGTSPGVSLAGGLISYVAALVVIAPFLITSKASSDLLSLRLLSARWFVVGGTFVCFAQMVRYMALSVAPVTVVTPILRTILVFRIAFSWLINREHEVFGVWVAVGILLSLIGALALTLNTEYVLSVIPLPEDVAAAARWRWPGS